MGYDKTTQWSWRSAPGGVSNWEQESLSELKYVFLVHNIHSYAILCLLFEVSNTESSFIEKIKLTSEERCVQVWRWELGEHHNDQTMALSYKQPMFFKKQGTDMPVSRKAEQSPPKQSRSMEWDWFDTEKGQIVSQLSLIFIQEICLHWGL